MQLKRLLVLLLAVILFVCPAFAEDEESNLLYNGGFEYLDDEGMPDGWYTDAYRLQEGYTSYSMVESSRSGDYAAEVNNIGDNDARFAQSVSVKPESLYRLSGWIRADDIPDSGHGANLSVEGVYVFSESFYDTDGVWQYVELYGETGEDQYEVTVFARVGGYSGESQGRAAFDDLRLEEVDAVPGEGIATLWFQQESTYVKEEVTEDGEASPFWPWLLVFSTVYALLALICLKYLNLRRNDLEEKQGVPAFFFVGICAATALRLICTLVEGYEVDINCFLAWGNWMVSGGPWNFYQPERFCDYTPGYLYVLGANSLVSALMPNRWSQVLAFKLVPMLCDTLMGCLLYRFAREEGLNRNQAGLMGLLTLFNPAIIVNSAAWGQMDSVLALGLMLVAWLAMRRKWQAVLPLYVVCALIKPQALMLGFLGLTAILMAWIRHKEDRGPILAGVGIALGAAAVIVVPFSIYKGGIGWLIELYANTLASYPYATVNTANLYYLLDANWVSIEYACGWAAPAIFSGLCLLWGCVTLRRQRSMKLALLEPLMMFAFAAAYLVMCFVNVSWSVVGFTAMALAFAVVLPMFIRSGKLSALPLCGGVLFVLLYVLGIKMHERYLFPALILLAMGYAVCRDKRVLLVLTAVSCTMFVNEGIVLDNSVRLGAAMGHLNADTQWLNILMSVVNVACVPFAVWVCHRVCVEKADAKLQDELSTRIPVRNYAEKPCTPLNYKADASLRWCWLDTVLVLAVTVVYSVVCLWNLGSTKAPQSAWRSTSAQESVVIDLGQHYDNATMLYFCEVSYNDFSIAASDDGEEWSEEIWAQMDQGQCFRWKYLSRSYTDSSGKRNYYGTSAPDDVQRFSGRYVRITAQQIGLILNEVIFRDAEGRDIAAFVTERTGANQESPLLSDPRNLLDEQDTLEAIPGLPEGASAEPGWYNSTYFDEIYHARTALEHLRGDAPYETSHPPLGKLLMSVSVAVFGMTPFGWRFAGALAGILMLPAMYVLGKQLTKRTGMGFWAMSLMALDCMHLTQTRIATIDSFPVLFVILSYLFMVRFMQRDMTLDPLRKLLPDLALSGLFMGCGVASKWIGVYAGVGLAVLYFWNCARHLRLSFQSAELTCLRTDLDDETVHMLQLRDKRALRRFVVMCLWCLLFFVTIPAAIYLCSYIPYFAYTHVKSVGNFLEMVMNSQEGMLNYHATPGLGMDHPFHSPWYEWPLIIRPMYYAVAQFMPKDTSLAIFCFGNPAVWLAGLAGIAAVVAVWAKRHVYRLESSDSLLHGASDNWDIAPAFVLIGLLAQFLPWVLVPRGTYIYHYFASIPFLILGTMLLLHWLHKHMPRVANIVTAVYLIVSLAMFVAFYPYASGTPVPVGWLDFMSNFLRLYHS